MIRNKIDCYVVDTFCNDEKDTELKSVSFISIMIFYLKIIFND